MYDVLILCFLTYVNLNFYLESMKYFAWNSSIILELSAFSRLYE